MAKNAVVSHVNYENEVVTIYSWEDISFKEMETRKFILLDTGDSFEMGHVNYINSIRTPEGVVHLFEQY